VGNTSLLSRSQGRPLPELIFGDLWEYDPAPETADPKLKARYDLFIPLSGVNPDAIVENGWHAFNLTHPRAMFEFIASEMGL